MNATFFPVRRVIAILWLALGICAPYASGQAVLTIQQATLMEPDQKTLEISTEELRKILTEKSATVFDARPFNEYAVSHIPSAVNVAAKPGVPISLYVSDVAEIGRGVQERPARPRVLRGESPLPSIARFGRLAYSMHMKVTTCVLLERKRHSCPAVIGLRRWERPGWQANLEA